MKYTVYILVTHVETPYVSIMYKKKDITSS